MKSTSSLVQSLAMAFVFAFVSTSCSEKATTKRLPIDSRDSVVVMVIGEDGRSVLELLQRGNRVEFESSSMGAFVTAINEVRNGDGVYWMYSINDTMVPMASERMMTRAGDTVRWRFRKQGK